MPPRVLNGSGAKRVHKTTPSGKGSPDATPRVNNPLPLSVPWANAFPKNNEYRNAWAPNLPVKANNLRREIMLDTFFHILAKYSSIHDTLEKVTATGRFYNDG
jgi:hypothetical protein